MSLTPQTLPTPKPVDEVHFVAPREAVWNFVGMTFDLEGKDPKVDVPRLLGMVRQEAYTDLAFVLLVLMASTDISQDTPRGRFDPTDGEIGPVAEFLLYRLSGLSTEEILAVLEPEDEEDPS